jgi:hypothetical protein
MRSSIRYRLVKSGQPPLKTVKFKLKPGYLVTLKGAPDSENHVTRLAQRSSYVCLPAIFL